MQNTGELLIQYLRDCAQSKSIVEYTRLNEITGIDVTKRRSCLYTAMEHVLRDYGYSFKCLPGKGYEPLYGVKQCETIGDKSRRKIKSITGKWRNGYNGVNPGALEQNELSSYIREGCRLHVAETITSESTEKRVQDVVAATLHNNPLSHGNMKKMLKESARMLAGVG